MAHYFDEILSRGTQSKTPHTPRRGHLRRSSTSRSIGNRSDFETMNGDEDTGEMNMRSSFYLSNPNPNRERERVEADTHLHLYISEQLEHLRANQDADEFDAADEFEAQV